MKTRIKGITYEDGRTWYTPQWRYFWFHPWDDLAVAHQDIKYAKKHIDEFLVRERAWTVKKTEYIKYP